MKPKVLTLFSALLFIAGTTSVQGFDSGTNFPTAGTSVNPRAVAVGDFNGDGFPDLFTTGNTTATVFINNQSGAFSTNSLTFAVGGEVSAAAGNFDKVNNDDIVASSGNGIHVRLNANGLGTSWSAEDTYNIGRPPMIRAADLNGDTWLDLVATTNNGNVVVLMNDQDGTFTQSQSMALSGNDTRGLAVGDIDGDGDIDIVASNLGGTATIRVFLNRSTGNSLATGTFSTTANQEFGVGDSEIRGLNLGNFDSDANLELAAPGYSVMRIFDNGGSTPFDTTATATAAVTQLEDFVVGPIDGDAFTDVLVGPSGGGALRYIPSNGSNGFGTAVTLASTFAAFSKGAVVDVNGDGEEDIIAARETGAGITVFLADPPADTTPPTLSSIAMFTSNASGAFARTGDTITLEFTASETLAALPTVTIAGKAATVLSTGNDYTATVTVAGGDPQGAAAFSISSYQDLATNAGSTVTTLSTGSAIAIDTVAPSISSVTMTTSNANASYARAGDTISLLFIASEQLAAAPMVTIAGKAASISSLGNSYTADITVAGADPQGAASFTVASVADAAGNTSSAVSTLSSGSATIIDTVAPAPVIYAFPTVTNETVAGGVSIDFLEDVVAPTLGQFNTSGATLSNLATIDGGTYRFDATLTGGDGMKSITYPAGATTDGAGNANVASSTANITLDTAAPTTTVTAPANIVGTSVEITATPDAGTGTAVTASTLWVSTPGSGIFAESPLVPVGNVFTYTATASGVYGFYVVSTDAAGNEESKSTADTFTVVNTVENAGLALDITGNGTYVFPMEPGLNVLVNLTGVTTPGTLTISRTEGNAAPAGYDAARLIDQVIVITPGGGLAFASAEITVQYDGLLLGGVAANAIAIAVRDNAGVVTAVPATVNTTAGTITFTTTGFSTWYFGEAAAAVGDWTLLND